MIELVFLPLLIAAYFVAMGSPKRGILACIVVGLVQDPLRKLVPGQPVSLTLLVVGCAGALFVGTRAAGIPVGLRTLHARNPVLVAPLSAFVAWVLFESARTVQTTGSITLASLGVLSYFAPIAGTLLGYALSRTDTDVLRFLRFYAYAAAATSMTVFLSYFGYQSALLKPVGVGLYAYAAGYEGQLELLCGLFRGSEIAGWHAAAAVCALVILLVVRGQSQRRLVPTGILIFLLCGAILLTGRRKFLVEVAVFVGLYLIGLYRSGAFGLRYTLLIASVAGIGYGAFAYVIPSSVFGGMLPYYTRTLSVTDEAGGRFRGNAIESLQYVLNQNGVFGSGAGTGTAGAQYAGGQLTGASAEGGIGKVLAELGIPGMLILAWLAIASVRYIFSVIRTTGMARDPARVKLANGLAAFLGANLTVFTITAQIFGDPFVLLLIGWTFGALLALPVRTLVRRPPPNSRATFRGGQAGKATVNAIRPKPLTGGASS